jgi:hypothetical protein
VGYFGEPPFDAGYFAALSESDYFDCDYFAPTYFDTPNCDGATTGKVAYGFRRPRPTPLLDEGEELFALV